MPSFIQVTRKPWYSSSFETMRSAIRPTLPRLMPVDHLFILRRDCLFDFVLTLLASCDEAVQCIRNKSFGETCNERPDEKFPPV